MRVLITVLLLLPLTGQGSPRFHYSLEQFALIAGYEDCVREMGQQLSHGQRDALVDKLLRQRGLSYQPRKVANDRRLWAYDEHASEQRLLGYLIPANKLDCLERYEGRH